MEISGIYYMPQQKKILAIADDKGVVFSIDTLGKEVQDYFDKPFGKTLDYEDIVQVDSMIYVLISNGSIVEINKKGEASTYVFPTERKNDFETIYYDPDSKGLIILCKKCSHEGKTRTRTAYRFDLTTKRFDPGDFYAINSKKVSDILKDGIADFEPSAAAIHPIQKKLYILSSAGNLLVIADLKGNVEHVYRLNPGIFPQAEGITFLPNGDMFISNEGKLGVPTLLRFNFKRPNDSK